MGERAKVAALPDALRAELPREYQRREDAIRSESIVMAKLDVLAMKLDRINQGGASS